MIRTLLAIAIVLLTASSAVAQTDADAARQRQRQRRSRARRRFHRQCGRAGADPAVPRPRPRHHRRGAGRAGARGAARAQRDRRRHRRHPRSAGDARGAHAVAEGNRNRGGARAGTPQRTRQCRKPLAQLSTATCASCSSTPTHRGGLPPIAVRYDPRNARFDVTFEIAREQGASPTRLRFTGTAVETVEAAIVTRSVERGEILKSADVVIERRPKAEAGYDPAPRERVVGMQMRKSVRAGQYLRMADLAKPDLVQRDQNVTLIYETGGLYLTMRGKAMDAGSEGDTVNVINLQSKRTVQGTVTGPGQVTMSVVAPRLTASLSQDRTCGRSANHRVSDHVLGSIEAAFPGHRRACSRSRLRPAAARRSSGCRRSAKSPRCRRSRIRPRSRATSRCRCRCRRRRRRATARTRSGATARAPSSRTSARARSATCSPCQVNITDKATFDNETKRSRTNTEDSGVSDFAGSKLLTGNAAKVMPGKILTADSMAESEGKGSVNRQPRRCRPASPPSSRRSCRTAISWSKAGRKSASTSRSAN